MEESSGIFHDKPRGMWRAQIGDVGVTLALRAGRQKARVGKHAGRNVRRSDEVRSEGGRLGTRRIRTRANWNAHGQRRELGEARGSEDARGRS
jgi:hypothetical protein